MRLLGLQKLKYLNLSKQLVLILSVIFVVGIGISAYSIANMMNIKAQNEISLQAQILLETTGALRDYTNNQITPNLQRNSQEIFLPQTVPSYSAREVFEKFRENPSRKDFFYKEATLNPTNLRDKADPFETELIDSFRQERNIKKLAGFRSIANNKLFYIAQPLEITQPSCLQCHGKPELAPKSMIDRYGEDNGFGWKLNEIFTARIIYVPANKVLYTARRSFIKAMSSVVAIFAVTLFIVNWWLNRYIVRPLNRMSKTAEAVSQGQIQAEFEASSQNEIGRYDEVGRLAKAFTLMQTSLKISINKLEEFASRLRNLDASQ
ncbi:MAG: DUF3365 domain-containing protein [Xenococcaceae cyanobacterium MO_167.B52]|nr:DUF3365 domain-containing protein [Xenococcaceae cyanobacterium MO_167.B52]